MSEHDPVDPESANSGQRDEVSELSLQYSWPRRLFEKFLAPADNGSRESLYYLFVAALALVLIFFTVAVCIRPGVDGGTFGDFLGGTLNPLLTFITFMALLITIVLQQTELGDTRKELAASARALEAQRRSLDRQNFESTFFQMLTLHNTIVNSIDLEWRAGAPYSSHNTGGGTVRRIVGRDCFKRFFLFYKHSYDSSKELDERKRLQESYDDFWDQRQQDLAHYYRYFYNVLRFVYEYKGIDDKLRCVKLLRAQLSDYELIMLCYTALNKNGIRYWRYIDEYGLFDNLPLKMLMQPGHKNLYSERSFGSRNPESDVGDIWPPSKIAEIFEKRHN